MANNRWKKSIFSGICALVLFAGLAATARADSSMELRVTATVMAVTRVQVVSQPAALEITAADVARGYVELPAAVQVVVRNNTGRGYLLVLESQGALFRQAQVHGLAAPVTLGGSGGIVPQPAFHPGSTRSRLALGFRFELPAGTQPGSYPWPLHLSAEPA